MTAFQGQVGLPDDKRVSNDHCLEHDRSPADRPLVVDLEGALLRTDLLLESFFELLAVEPLKAFRAITALKDGKAALKSRLADEVLLEMSTLPFNEQILAYVRVEKAKGRRIFLASTSDQRYVEALASHLGLFHGSLGSDTANDLAGATKAERLCAIFGEQGFDYIGDAPPDGPVCLNWTYNYNAYAATGIGGTWNSWRDYLNSIRVHQWLKNILVLVPALAAHQFGWPLVTSLVAFLSFSLCASSVYILNDLLDLKNDRSHTRKRDRPFAAGRLPIIRGAVLAPLLLVAALVPAWFLPPAFLATLFGYYALTCAYSFFLKRKMLVDVVALACLYGARLIAGSAASGIALSPWLIGFAIFLFLSLALVKRCSELIDRRNAGEGNPVGRAYRLDDLPILQAMCVASSYLAVLILALYLNNDAVRVLYGEPARLWLLCVLLLYWVSRMSLLTHRGEMHDDPVVFAATDRISQIAAVCGGAIVLASM